MLEQRDVDHVLALGDADPIAERANRLGRVAAAAHPGDGRHARIVPARHRPFLDQREQLALAHHRVGQVQPRELDLPRLRRHRQVGDQPVVERPVILELQRAERVGDLLDRVRRRMREVVHRIDAPRVAGPMMVRAPDAVEDRIAHRDVRRRHVDLRAQHVGAVLELAGAHPREQVEVLFDGAAAVRAVLPRLGERAAVGPHLVGGQAVHIGQAVLDEVHGVAVERLEIVGGVARLTAPVEAQPADVLLDGVHVLDVFLRGIGVVEAEVARAAEFGGDAEVQADRLGMADVQVAVRLGREAGGHTAMMLPVLDIRRDDRADEVERRIGFTHRPGCGCVGSHGGKPLLYDELRESGTGVRLLMMYSSTSPRLDAFELIARRALTR